MGKELSQQMKYYNAHKEERKKAFKDYYERKKEERKEYRKKC